MYNDKVSILIPAYNRAQYIGACLNSIFQQSYQNIEVIVYDDGSTDNTVAIVRQYPKVKLICGEENRGVSYARNVLLEACNTRYAAWQDSDDIANRFRIEAQLQCLQDTSSALSYTNWKYFVDGFNIDLDALPKLLLGNNTKCMGSVMMDLKKVKSTLFNEQINMGGEDFVWLKAVEDEWGFGTIVRRQLYYVRNHAQRISKLKFNPEFQLQKELSDNHYAAAMNALAS